MNKTLILFVFLFILACKTNEKQTNRIHRINTTQATPGTCKIIGKITQINKIESKDTKDICSQYPCLAMVEIMDVTATGSGVTVPMRVGDIVKMRFTYTLSNTKNIFKEIKEPYPGLEKGDVFIGVALQQMFAGNSDPKFVIGDYELK